MPSPRRTIAAVLETTKQCHSGRQEPLHSFVNDLMLLPVNVHILTMVVLVRRLINSERMLQRKCCGFFFLICVCLCVCDPASGHRGCVYCGEAVLQQPGGHSQPEGPKEAQSLSFQEGNRDLQLLLFQHHPGREAQQTGGRMKTRNTTPLTDLF